MPLESALLALMLSMPAPYETDPGREVRLGRIAQAITFETRNPAGWLPSWSRRDRALLVLVKTYHESARWSLAVHSGRKKGDAGRSTCLGQIMSGPWISRSLWASLAGIGPNATHRCIKVVVRYLARSRRKCASGQGPNASSAALTYSLYATGYTCGPIELARKRGRHFARLRNK